MVHEAVPAGPGKLPVTHSQSNLALDAAAVSVMDPSLAAGARKPPTKAAFAKLRSPADADEVETNAALNSAFAEPLADGSFHDERLAANGVLGVLGPIGGDAKPSTPVVREPSRGTVGTKPAPLSGNLASPARSALPAKSAPDPDSGGFGFGMLAAIAGGGMLVGVVAAAAGGSSSGDAPGAPLVSGFSASAGQFKTGESVLITAMFNQSLQAGASLRLTLNTGAIVTLTSAASDSTLTGVYVVAWGESTDSLAVSSLAAGSSPPTSVDGLVMTSTTLPAINLSGILIDGVAPTILFSSGTSTKTLYANAALVGAGKAALPVLDGSMVLGDNATSVAFSNVHLSLGGFLNGASEALSVGGSSLAANGAGAPSAIIVNGTAWSVTFASGGYTFMPASGSATASQAAALLNFTYANVAIAAAEGVRTIAVTVADAVGNVSANATVSVTLDFTPPNAVTTITALSADTGVSQTDFLTAVSSQSVSGSFSSGTVAATERVQVSADNGVTWSAAVIVDATHWRADGVTLTRGTHDVRARVVDAADNTGVTTIRAYTYNDTVLAASATLQSASESVSVNSSLVGPFLADTSTDGNVVSLSGAIIGTRGVNEFVLIYDDFGGLHALGTARLSGASWTFTTPTLAAGVHNLSARVEDASAAQSRATTSFKLIEQGNVIDAVIDDAGGITGNVAVTGRYVRIYHSTNQTLLKLTEMKVFSHGNEVAGGLASTSGTNVGTLVNTFRDNPLALTDGNLGGAWNGGTGTGSNVAYAEGNTTLKGSSYIELDLGSIKDIDSVKLWAASDSSSFTNSDIQVFLSNTPFLNSDTAYDTLARNGDVARATFPTVSGTAGNIGGTASGGLARTDDNRPSLRGHLLAALGGNEEVALYDSFNGAIPSRLGAAEVIGLNWTYLNLGTAPNLGIGSHIISAVVEPKGATSIASGGRVVSDGNSVQVDVAGTGTVLSKDATILRGNDDSAINGSATGAMTSGATTDDTTVTLIGQFPAGRAPNSAEVTAFWDTTSSGLTLLGTLLGDLDWTWTSPVLSPGTHSIQTRVQNASTGDAGAFSAPFVVTIQGVNGVTLNDDFGTRKGDLTTSIRYLRIYHTDASDTALTGLQVYAGGRDVAAGRASSIGFDAGTQDTYRVYNNDYALTDSSYGGTALIPGDALPVYAKSNVAYAKPAASGSATAKPYIELDLGAIYDVQSLHIYGAGPGYPSNNLRLYYSTTPMLTSSAAYTALAADAGVGELQLSTIDGTATGTVIAGLIRTDDNRPSLRGSLTAALLAGQELAIYDDSVRLSAVTPDAALNWSFTPTGLIDGNHVLTAVVQTIANNGDPFKRIAVSAGTGFQVDTTGTTGLSVSGDPAGDTNDARATATSFSMTDERSAGNTGHFTISGVSQIVDLGGVVVRSTASVDHINLGPTVNAGNLMRITLADVSQADLGGHESLSRGIAMLGEGKHQLIVDGVAGSAVSVGDGIWSAQGTVAGGGHIYDVYTSGAAQLLIDTSLTRYGAVI